MCNSGKNPASARILPPVFNKFGDQAEATRAKFESACVYLQPVKIQKAESKGETKSTIPISGSVPAFYLLKNDAKTPTLTGYNGHGEVVSVRTLNLPKNVDVDFTVNPWIMLSNGTIVILVQSEQKLVIVPVGKDAYVKRLKEISPVFDVMESVNGLLFDLKHKLVDLKYKLVEFPRNCVCIWTNELIVSMDMLGNQFGRLSIRSEFVDVTPDKTRLFFWNQEEIYYADASTLYNDAHHNRYKTVSIHGDKQSVAILSSNQFVFVNYLNAACMYDIAKGEYSMIPMTEYAPTERIRLVVDRQYIAVINDSTNTIRVYNQKLELQFRLVDGCCDGDVQFQFPYIGTDQYDVHVIRNLESEDRNKTCEIQRTIYPFDQLKPYLSTPPYRFHVLDGTVVIGNKTGTVLLRKSNTTLSLEHIDRSCILINESKSDSLGGSPPTIPPTVPSEKKEPETSPEVKQLEPPVNPPQPPVKSEDPPQVTKSEAVKIEQVPEKKDEPLVVVEPSKETPVIIIAGSTPPASAGYCVVC
jgi:hypothetical protein